MATRSSGSSQGSKQRGSGKYNMIRQLTGAGSIVLILVAALYHPGAAAAHGAASGEDDPCLRRVGERMVHFSAYQPQYDLKDQYCTDIPKEGDTFLVVDLVDPALRSEPVGMRVTKGNGSDQAENQIVADFGPSTHPEGTHDRLSEACAYRGSTTDRSAATCLAPVQARTIEMAAKLVGCPPFVETRRAGPGA